MRHNAYTWAAYLQDLMDRAPDESPAWALAKSLRQHFVLPEYCSFAENASQRYSDFIVNANRLFRTGDIYKCRQEAETSMDVTIIDEMIENMRDAIESAKSLSLEP